MAGITGATGAVAGAYIADITDGEDRMSACFGVGMVAGPVAGGLLGAISLHAPFLAAAVLNGLNLLLGCFLMQESHKGERRYWLNYAASEQIVLRVHHMRCEIPHRCVRRKYRIRRSSASSLTDSLRSVVRLRRAVSAHSKAVIRLSTESGDNAGKNM